MKLVFNIQAQPQPQQPDQDPDKVEAICVL